MVSTYSWLSLNLPCRPQTNRDLSASVPEVRRLKTCATICGLSIGWFPCMYACALCVCVVLELVRIRCHISWNWICGQLLASMWVLGTKPESSVRAERALNYEPSLHSFR